MGGMMNDVGLGKLNWTVIAQRIVRGLGVRPDELILVRDDSGRMGVVEPILLAIELAGATPLLQLTPTNYMEQLWERGTSGYLKNWDKHRASWVEQADRILVLAGAQPRFETIPTEAFMAWQTAEQRLTEIEEERLLPYLLVAVPTALRAEQVGMSLTELDAYLMPALAAGVNELYRAMDRVLTAVRHATQLTIQTGNGCELRVMLDPKRAWHSDDGFIDEQDMAKGSIVSNLPAGSLYTTVVESASSGTLFVPRSGNARNIMFTLENGRISHIEAEEGGEALTTLFAQNTGEPGRIGHIGIGLNPHLNRPIGWTLVDEHVGGYLFVSFGENRYMGGENESSLNVDFAIPEATLLADGKRVIQNGRLRGWTR